MSEIQIARDILPSRNTVLDRHGASFHDAMREWLKDAPWIFVSIIIHAIMGLIVANIEWQTLKADQFQVLHAVVHDDELEPLPETEWVEEQKEPEEPDEIKETPEVTDVFEDVEIEDDDPSPIDSPFDLNNVNEIIGTGGGGGEGGPKYIERRKGGGGVATQRAVENGLDWLKRHQDPEGHWDCDRFDMQCSDSPVCSGRGGPLNDTGVTGLALLAFLGAGHTPETGPYRNVVRAGCHYLKDVQDPEDGCLSPKEGDHYMYNHAIACLALTEAYGLSRMGSLKRPAKQAIEFIHNTKNPGKAWRYNIGEADPIEQNDVSVTGWMIMCLASARDFDLPCYMEDIEDALMYLDEMTDSATGRTGYKERGSYSSREAGDEIIWPFEKVEAMTAVAMLCRVFCGDILGDLDAQKEPLQKGAKLLRKKLPKWDVHGGDIDYYYWYYGSYAMYQMGGDDWRAWKDHMVKTVVAHQITEGCAKGSWDPGFDPWGDSGGRVYATALCTLCLEVFYRYTNIVGARLGKI